MNQEKIGKFIKEIRKNHNLTQKQFANKYNVTHQAVSKWESGINLPDSLLLKKISEDFGVTLDELYNGEFNNTVKVKRKNFLIIYIVVFIIVVLVIFLIISKFFFDNDFKFNTLSTSSENFTISGSISYNNAKSAIYITNIKYLGDSNKLEYKKIECTFYESNSEIDVKISSYKYDDNKLIRLDDFLEKVTFVIDDYENSYIKNKNNNLFLSINATDNKDKITTFIIPLKLE